jgi:hypothetical protein
MQDGAGLLTIVAKLPAGVRLECRQVIREARSPALALEKRS